MRKLKYKEINLAQANMPKKLYKYRSAKDPLHLQLLEDNSVYFAPYSSFNDPNEHNLPTDYEAVKPYHLYKFIKKVEKRMPGESKLAYEVRTHKLIQNTKFYDQQNREETENHYKEIFDHSRGVLSLGTSFSVEALWEKFADQYSGFCVELSMDFFIENKVIKGTAGNIDYYDPKNPPKLRVFTKTDSDKVNEVMKNVYSLPNTLEHEEEYRITRTLFGQARHLIFDTKCLTAVYLGFRMSNSLREKIIELTRRKYLYALIYQQVNESGNLRYDQLES